MCVKRYIDLPFTTVYKRYSYRISFIVLFSDPVAFRIHIIIFFLVQECRRKLLRCGGGGVRQGVTVRE